MDDSWVLSHSTIHRVEFSFVNFIDQQECLATLPNTCELSRLRGLD